MTTIDDMILAIIDMIEDELDIDQFVFVIKSLIKHYSTTVEHSANDIIAELVDQIDK